MAVEAVRVCPSCSAKNKPTWEFCARCGEELENVTIVPMESDSAEAETVVQRTVADAVADRDDAAPVEAYDSGISWGGLLRFGLGLGACLLLLAVWPRSIDKPGAVSILPPGAPATTAQPFQQPPGQASYEKGRRLFEAGDLDGAIAMLADAVKTAPSETSYRQLYARALWTRGDLEAASTQLRECIRLEPHVTSFRMDLGKILASSGRIDLAIREYEDAFSRTPPNGESLRMLAHLYSLAGNVEGTVSALKRALDLRRDDALIETDLGQALERAGDLPGAASAYRSVLSRVPDATITRALLADVLLKNGQNSEAIDTLRAGLARSPSSPLLHRSLGSVLERTGDLSKAAAAYREYARLAPRNADAAKLQQRAVLLEKRLAAS